MFGVDSSELFVVAVLALIFIGPKELPTTMRTVGRWVGRARAHARHFTAGIENMMREAELEEMEKKWREENERIMREFPQPLPYPGAPMEAGAPAPLVPSEGSPELGRGVEARSGVISTQRPSTALGTSADENSEPQLPLPPPDTRQQPLP
jgi:sec-independent protein translocase protein TatB